MEKKDLNNKLAQLLSLLKGYSYIEIKNLLKKVSDEVEKECKF